MRPPSIFLNLFSCAAYVSFPAKNFYLFEKSNKRTFSYVNCKVNEKNSAKVFIFPSVSCTGAGTKILLVAGVFLVSFLFTCDILVTSLPYLPNDGLVFFCFRLCGGFKFAVVA